MKKIILLGASGSIGSYLAIHLSNFFEVIATSRSNTQLFENITIENFKCFNKPKDIKFEQ